MTSTKKKDNATAAVAAASPPPPSSSAASSTNNLITVIGICVMISAIVNIVHVQQLPEGIGVADGLATFKRSFSSEATAAAALLDNQDDNDNNNNKEEDEDDEERGADERGHAFEQDERRNQNKKGFDDDERHYGQLDCSAFGGPSLEDAQELVYWQDIASDERYVSPFMVKKGKQKKSKTLQKQYMTFEPDGGGWNNIRMAMETVLGMAVATGRILVLPPEQRMYLLAKNRGKMKTDFSFMDFFPMKELASENDALHIITMQEFLETEAMAGNLRDKNTGEVTFPPGNQTNWDGQDVKGLKEWLRNATHTPLWSPDKCIAAFPASGEHKDSIALVQMHNDIIQQGMIREEYLDHPLPLDATPRERMKEMLGKRNALCLYDEEMQQESVLHFMCYHKMRVRMLTHFYVFLFFEDWREDLWMKRFIRDHVRYNDEIQCAAARVVKAMREYAKSKDKKGNGEFDTFHIRRGDFQFKRTRIDATEIYDNVKDVLKDGSIVYIATDERDKNFFNPLKEHYDIKFMDDFMDELKDVNHNYFGMIDQLVASRGRLFFGCWHSTFTGYIDRIRGYHSVKDRLPGHEEGLLPNSFYYVPKVNKYSMHKYAVIQPAYFNREFPTSWRGLDYGIGKLPDRDISVTKN